MTALDTSRFEGAVKVRVEATVVFEAYALPDAEHRALIEDRITSEIRDALHHHAPHLHEVDEDTDALVALIDAEVSEITVLVATTTAPVEDVVRAIEHTRAFMS